MHLQTGKRVMLRLAPHSLMGVPLALGTEVEPTGSEASRAHSPALLLAQTCRGPNQGRLDRDPKPSCRPQGFQRRPGHGLLVSDTEQGTLSGPQCRDHQAQPHTFLHWLLMTSLRQNHHQALTPSSGSFLSCLLLLPVLSLCLLAFQNLLNKTDTGLAGGLAAPSSPAASSLSRRRGHPSLGQEHSLPLVSQALH